MPNEETADKRYKYKEELHSGDDPGCSFLQGDKSAERKRRDNVEFRIPDERSGITNI